MNYIKFIRKCKHHTETIFCIDGIIYNKNISKKLRIINKNRGTQVKQITKVYKDGSFTYKNSIFKHHIEYWFIVIKMPRIVTIRYKHKID